MPDRPLDVRQLRQVSEIVRYGSLGRAARALGISQPTLSRSVARIEDLLGVKLFERRRSGVIPNMFAEHIAARAATLLDSANEISAEVLALSRGEGSVLRIGVGAGTREMFTAKIMAELLAAFPHLRLQMRQDRVPELFRSIKDHSLDLLFVAKETVPRGPNYVSVELTLDEIIFVSATTHPLASRTSLTIADILDHPIASPGVFAGFQALLPHDLTPVQTRNLTAIVAQDFRFLLDVVQEGLAVTYVSKQILRALGSQGLAILNVDVRWPYRASAVATPYTMESPVVRGVIKALKRPQQSIGSSLHPRGCSWRAFKPVLNAAF